MAGGAGSQHDDGAWRYASASPYAVASASRFNLLPPRHGEAAGYKCSFCNRSFASPQARGGHQNAHKKELAELRKSLKEEAENQRAKRARPDFSNASRDQALTPPEVDASEFLWQAPVPK